MQANTNTRPKFWKTGSRHKLWGDHERRVETTLPEWLQPVTEGLTRGFSSSADLSPADVAIPLPAIPPSAHHQQSLLQTYYEEITICSRIFPDPELRSMQTHESYKGAMQKIWGYDNSRPSKFFVASPICSGRAGLGDAMGSMLSMQNQISPGDVENS